MLKLILNYKCNSCGFGFYNVLEELYKCPECDSNELTMITPLKVNSVKRSSHPWSEIKRKSGKKSII